MRLVILGLALVAYLPSFAAAQPAKVKDWIKDLDSANYATREKAAKNLLALREDAVEPLQEALKAPPKNLEYKRRLQSLLHQASEYSRDGEPVNGLRLMLQTSNDTLMVGDSMTLLTTVSNVSDKPLMVVVGGFSNGNLLHSIGDRICAARDKTGKGSRMTTITMPSGGTLVYQTFITLENDSKGNYFLDCGQDARGAKFTLPVEPTGRLRVVHSVEPGNYDLRVVRFGEKKETQAWHGKVRSNDEGHC